MISTIVLVLTGVIFMLASRWAGRNLKSPIAQRLAVSLWVIWFMEAGVSVYLMR